MTIGGIRIYEEYDAKNYDNSWVLERKQDDSDDEQIETKIIPNFSSFEGYTSFPKHMVTHVDGMPIKIYGMTDIEAFEELKIAMTPLFTPVGADWVLMEENDEEFRDLVKLYLKKELDQERKEYIRERFQELYRWRYTEEDVPDLLQILALYQKPYYALDYTYVDHSADAKWPRIITIKKAIEQFFEPIVIEEDDLVSEIEEIERQKRFTLEEICIENEVGIVYVANNRFVTFGGPIPNLQ
jgi:hypothetical protein